MISRPFIKLCGVRERSVLAAAVETGATAIGFNCVPWSRRFVDVAAARELLSWARGEYEALPLIVGVFADAEPELVGETRLALGLDVVQLHGTENPSMVAELAPAIKAIGLAEDADLETLGRFSGGPVIVDTRVAGVVGGTGQRIPAALAQRACRLHDVVVAGGLDFRNVRQLIETVNPIGVDTAGGAEDEQGRPSAMHARRFVQAARAAFQQWKYREMWDE